MKYPFLFFCLLFFIPNKINAQNIKSFLSSNVGISNINNYHWSDFEKKGFGPSYELSFNLERRLSSKDYLGFDIGWIQLNDKSTFEDQAINSPENEWVFDTLAIVDITRASKINYAKVSIYFKHEYGKVNFKHGVQILRKFNSSEFLKFNGTTLTGEKYNKKENYGTGKHFKNLNWGYIMGVEYKIKPKLFITLNTALSINEIVKNFKNSRTFYSSIGLKYQILNN